MTQAWLTGYDGTKLALPPFTGYRLKRTGGVPCDSFEGTCPWDGDLDTRLADAVRLIVEEDGVRRFTGVVDEYQLSWDQGGGELSVSGRGLAALLLDNEARGQDYQVATLQDILRDHVTPYGIETAAVGRLPAVPGFSVETGSSEWKVLYSFARYHGGVEPRFDVYGRLSVSGEESGREVVLDGRNGATSLLWRDKRYGVCSEVLVLDRGSLTPQRVVNQEFARKGGACRRVVTMPGKSAYQAMRYSGQFQLDRSYEERLRLEITAPGNWLCEPGDRVHVDLERPRLSGVWKALEVENVLDGTGRWVRLTLG